MPSSSRSRWVLITLAVLLVVSLGANVIFVKALQQSFEKLQFARIFPLGYAPERAASTPSTAATPAESIALWGDSRAYLWDTTTLAHGRTVLNFAHGGQTSSQLLLQIMSTPAVHSTYAVVQIGINDLHPLGAMTEERQRVLDALRSNLAAIRDELLKRSDQLVLTTIFPPGPVPLQRRFAWDAHTLATIEDINRLIAEVGNVPRARVLDANALLRDGKGVLASTYADPDFFLHVNREAYARLNAGLAPLLSP